MQFHLTQWSSGCIILNLSTNFTHLIPCLSQEMKCTYRVLLIPTFHYHWFYLYLLSTITGSTYNSFSQSLVLLVPPFHYHWFYLYLHSTITVSTYTYIPLSLILLTPPFHYHRFYLNLHSTITGSTYTYIPLSLILLIPTFHYHWFYLYTNSTITGSTYTVTLIYGDLSYKGQRSKLGFSFVPGQQP